MHSIAKTFAAKLVVLSLLGALSATVSAGGTSCLRGQQMQQSAGNAAAADMQSADAVYNNMKNAMQQSNNQCFNTLKSINVSGMIPPLPLPSAVGGVVSNFMNSVVTQTFTKACSSVTSSLSGAVGGLNSQNMVLPGGVGRLSNGTIQNILQNSTGGTLLNGVTGTLANGVGTNLTQQAGSIVNQQVGGLVNQGVQTLNNAASQVTPPVNSAWK